MRESAYLRKLANALVNPLHRINADSESSSGRLWNRKRQNRSQSFGALVSGAARPW